MTVVKVCGLTTLPDAQAALAAGAGLLGFICFPGSPRYVAPPQIAAIVSGLTPAGAPFRTVGVFVNASFEQIEQVMAEAGLDLAQLHGEEPPTLLHRLGGRAFKALRPTSLAEAEAAAASHASAQSAHRTDQIPDLLVDGYHPQLYGGAGVRADWDIAAALAPRHRLLLAGGLTPANVAEAIARVRPWGVDVSSGVESAPGQKDHAAIHAFTQAVHSDL